MNRKLMPCGPAMLACTLTLILFAKTGHLATAQETYPEIEKFAADITDVVWDLRGTSSLKHLRYDGENVCSLNSRGEPGKPYDSAFVDTGVIRLDFRGPNAAWYFFGDNLKWVTPITSPGEIVFAVSDADAAKPVRDFPADIENVVFESQPDERSLAPMKLRWNGSELELGVSSEGAWQVEKHSPVVADRRVFEVTVPDQSVVWFAFSADGKEAWFLHIDTVFGGENRSNTDTNDAATSATLTGLKPQHQDLLRHAEKLKANGEKGRVATLERQLERHLAKQPDLAAEVQKRLADQ